MHSTTIYALLFTAACSGTDTGSLPDAGLVDAAPDAPSVCDPPTGAGTMHHSVNQAETWTAADSPHIVPFDIEVSAALTIESCAVVRLAAGDTITIQPGGTLVTLGEATRPVTIEALDPGAPWVTIRSLGGDLSLTNTTVQGGGAPANTNPAFAGALRMQSTTTGSLHVDHVVIANSASQGVYINGSVGFDATSRDLTVHGAVGFPVHVFANVIGTIPTGTYTGNGRDAIAIAGAGGSVRDSQTLHDRGVPYHVGSGPDGGRMDVNTMVSGTVAVLTIEPGVTMQFPAGGSLEIDPGSGTSPAQGALIAIGTAAQPIVFTSDQGASAAAGDWLGLTFSGAVDPRTVMQHARVEFAGGETVTGGNSCRYAGRVGTNYAAVRIFGPPSSQFITESEIVASSRDGIDRSWRADLQPDFLATNTFTSIAGCKETTPALANNGCPANPPCP